MLFFKICFKPLLDHSQPFNLMFFKHNITLYGQIYEQTSDIYTRHDMVVLFLSCYYLLLLNYHNFNPFGPWKKKLLNR